ncbi:hypothetical protein [Agrobacterium pusense]|uniref:Uncharacterized protein n=1 Tax=Agrobacterium pusense TaxID=648995 RepID=A0A6H0ZIC0_9HYPH|nr:hypothetical protein [Agrobacterium pusense]QIX20576.1 hypothetical protein FOB41_05200 [Agrobacterium pusense]WCK25327.1 hypothetical protein CFBP5496_0007060 [Agrobacterium pusense]
MAQALTLDHAHTALCIWEAWLETDTETAWTEYRDNRGAVQSRYACLHMAPQIEAVYAALSEEVRDGLCFDWEFVPSMLSYFSFSNFTEYPELVRPAVEIAAEFAGTLSTGQPTPETT